MKVFSSLVLLTGILTLQYHVASSAYAQALVTSSKNNFQLLQRQEKNGDYYHTILQADLKKAAAMQPKNSEIEEKIGRYYLLRRASQMGLASDEEESIKFYRNAIGMMPAKAEWWARFAYAKALANQFDKEFYTSYERAFYYGSGEYHVNEILIKIGLAHWYSMKVDSRLIFKKAVINAYSLKAYAILTLAHNYSQLRMVCIWVRGEGAPHRMCEQELEK